jgi:hypothetical protein
VLPAGLAAALGDSTSCTDCAYAVDFPADPSAFADNYDDGHSSGCYTPAILSEDNEGDNTLVYQHGTNAHILRGQLGNHSVFLDQSNTARHIFLSEFSIQTHHPTYIK